MQGTQIWSLVQNTSGSYTSGQLSLCATTTEAHTPRACALQQEKQPQWEAQAPQLESSPHSPQLDKARASVKTQHSQK